MERRGTGQLIRGVGQERERKMERKKELGREEIVMSENLVVDLYHTGVVHVSVDYRGYVNSPHTTLIHTDERFTTDYGR